MAAWVAPVVSGAVSLIGALLSRKKNKAPMAADYHWLQAYGPGIWDKLGASGRRLMDSPYGLGESKDIMRRMSRDVYGASYGAAQRANVQSARLSGLEPSGGQAARQSYYTGQQYAEGLDKAYSGIELADFQAKEEQRMRGENLLLALSNKNPAYSQIASQNYWNQLNANNQAAGALGGAVGNMYSMWQQQQMMDMWQQQQQQQQNTNMFNYYANPYTTPSYNPITYGGNWSLGRG